jgi:hypothetical protein
MLLTVRVKSIVNVSNKPPYEVLLVFKLSINIKGIKMNKKYMQVEKENISKTSVNNTPLTAKELNLAAVKIEKEMRLNKAKNVFKVFEVK